MCLCTASFAQRVFDDSWFLFECWSNVKSKKLQNAAGSGHLGRSHVPGEVPYDGPVSPDRAKMRSHEATDISTITAS